MCELLAMRFAIPLEWLTLDESRRTWIAAR